MRNFLLVGTDSVYSHGLNAVVKDLIKSFKAEGVGEEYVLLGSSSFDGVIAAIQRAKPDVVLNSLIGSSNIPFCQQLRGSGVSSARCPVVSYTLTEEEIQEFSPPDVAGDYITVNYLQSIGTPE